MLFCITAIQIGFTQSSRTIPRPLYHTTYEVEIASEDERISQQNFIMIVQAVASAPSTNIGVVNNNFLDMVFGNNRRIVFPQFYSYEKTHRLHIDIEPYYLSGTDPVAFELVISGMEHAPYFVHANNLHQSMFIIIE